ncbi:MAG TPA: response regulator transcription factor [Saprospiraceae bacterium]|nr:response regulator transcription factor [Saprospiraceae bacterium]HMQ83817.1 response regulator transcription factor [Saprospiraceae bacterium]
MKKVLIIEDDATIVELLEIHLKDLNLSLEKRYNGVEGLREAWNAGYALIILDIMLPGLDGLEICKRLRQEGIATPILMLTAKSEEIDKVLGLEFGADDYLTKPFSIREFIARVKALLRRTQVLNRQTIPEEAKSQLQYGELNIDLDKRKVSVEGKRIELSPKEFDLLSLLASNPGKSYERSKILNLVWGYEFDGYEHTVNSHINRLRSKIEPDVTSPTYILTSWGVGYRFNEEL